jgi:hypothetical protein
VDEQRDVQGHNGFVERVHLRRIERPRRVRVDVGGPQSQIADRPFQLGDRRVEILDGQLGGAE